MKEKVNTGYRKVTLTIPEALFHQVTEEAKVRGMAYEEYVKLVLEGDVRPVAGYRPLIIELAYLREAVAADGKDADVRKVVLNTCRRIDFFLAEQIRRMK